MPRFRLPRIASSEITPREVFANRREFLTSAAALGVGGALAGGLANFAAPAVKAAQKLQTVPGKLTTTGEVLTPIGKVTTYNNFYEFGTDKSEPAKNAHTLQTRPWSIAVEGLVKQPRTFDIDSILKYRPIEERVYRFRCVEAWSMVVPWDGYPLSEFIKACDPLPSAKFVQFLSLRDGKQMPQLGSSGFSSAYSEGLRMDEAMHPLTLLTVGLYGEVLPNQDGAPVRVIVPWKYGFKSAKSIVKIRFLAKMPPTTWNDMGPSEYGFYSNVNPTVDHPRWSQRTERRLTGGFFPKIVQTLPFNGYADQVAGLYNGMDLRKNY
ncbi:MAG TPA: protein-methionine-sulfoxide reductase catalytic subunit MsrP [Acidobacteriaceae bacterium]